MTITVEMQMEVLTCAVQGCGITFAVPAWWEERRRQDHTQWFCPNGHSQYFGAKTQAEKLREQLQKTQTELQEKQAEVNQERHLREVAQRAEKTARAAKTRVMKRVANGVCPHCNRTFQDLIRHMHGKHPTQLKALGIRVALLEDQRVDPS